MLTTTKYKDSTTNFDDVSRLAHQNWSSDGCPPGREGDYYQEAKRQIEALSNLLTHDPTTVAGWMAGLGGQLTLAPAFTETAPQKIEIQFADRRDLSAVSDKPQSS